MKKIIFEIMVRKLTTQDSIDNIKKHDFSQLKNSDDLRPILTDKGKKNSENHLYLSYNHVTDT